MAFFKRNAGGSKRKLGQKRKATGNAPKNAKRATKDDEILSSDDEEGGLVEGKHSLKNLSDHEEEIFEDAQTKSARESKRVLEQLEVDAKGDGELTDDDLDAISHRLKKEDVKRVQRRIADTVVIDEDSAQTYRPHKFSPVCIALSSDGRFVVSCSKDGSIAKYDLETNKKVAFMKHLKGSKNSHVGQVRCVAISGDDKFVASGGDDKTVRIWSLADLSHVKNFQGHQGPVTSLVFRQGSNDLYSASTDKCIRSWDLNQMGFVEIMYGHSDAISQLDMLDKPKLLSAGSTARTIHLFKIEQSSQLVFNGLNDCTSVDTISMINDEHYVSGQMNGSLYIWSVSKKKPVCVVKNAHGVDSEENPRWICSVASLPFTDLIASGSSDGNLKLWKVSENYKDLTLIDEFQLAGFLNDLRFSSDGKRLVCAVGQEHRSGRWWKCQEARNSIVALTLQHEADQKAVSDALEMDSD